MVQGLGFEVSGLGFGESYQAWEGVGWEETEQCTIHTIVLILHIANEVLLQKELASWDLGEGIHFVGEREGEGDERGKKRVLPWKRGTLAWMKQERDDYFHGGICFCLGFVFCDSSFILSL